MAQVRQQVQVVRNAGQFMTTKEIQGLKAEEIDD